MSFIVSEGYKNYIKGFIKDFLDKNGELPSKKDVLESGISVEPLITAFGSWKNVLISLEFGTNQIEKNINDDEAMQKLKELQEKLGSTPTLSKVKEEKIYIKNLLTKFGNWNNIKRVLKGELSEETAQKHEYRNNTFDLEKEVEELKDLTRELQKTPNIVEAKTKGLNVYKLVKLYGSWTNVKEELGLKNIEQEFIVSQIKEIQKETVKRPTLKSLKDNHVNIATLIKRYGTWKNACSVLNLNLYDLEGVKKEVFELANVLNRAPKRYELEECGIKVTPLIEEYNGWYNAVKSIKLDEFDEFKISEQIKNLSVKLDRTPTIEDLKVNHIKTSKIFKKYHGWTKFREKIGLPKYSRFNNSLLMQREQEIVVLGKKLGRTPTLKDIKANKISISPLINRYDGWNNLLMKLGFKPNNRYSKEAVELLKVDVRKIFSETGKTPTIKELRKAGIPINPIKKHYGSVAEFLLSMDLKPRLLRGDLFNKEAVLDELRALKEKIGKAPSLNQAKSAGIKTYGLVKVYGKWNAVKEAIMGEDKQEENINVELRLA